MRPFVALLVLASCGGHPHPAPASHAVSRGDDLTLYRDWAVIRQHIEIDIKGTSATVKAQVAAGVTADQIVVLDRGGISIGTLLVERHDDLEQKIKDLVGSASGSDDPPPPPDEDENTEEPANDTALEPPQGAEDTTDDEQSDFGKPVQITMEVSAPTPGHYAVDLGYVTNGLSWQAAYTMTANPARDRAVVRGALAIHNKTGIELNATSSRLIDADFGAWRGKSSEQLASQLVGATPSSTPPVTPRELGPLVLGTGETRVELLKPLTRKMSAVLVYDPIGTKNDHTGATPVEDYALGIEAKTPTRITENFEVIRDKKASEGLPAGPVRLLEQRADGSLAVLGESRLYDAASRVADVDTIAVGTAESVEGKRERRELTVDEENKRIVEEFNITVDNQRAYPVRVLLREHLYRGQNWTLAYHSAPDATKEGPQQIAMRTQVPAKSKKNVLYVVVYTWGQ
jgi:hypothetical protein